MVRAAPFLQLLAWEDELQLVGWDPLLDLNCSLVVVDSVGRLRTGSDHLARHCNHEDCASVFTPLLHFK